MSIDNENKKLNKKLIFILASIVIILITILIVLKTLKNNDIVNYEVEYMKSGKSVENIQNIHSIIKYDVKNNIKSIEQFEITDNVTNTLTGYIPTQNSIPQNISNLEEKIINPVREKVELKIYEDTLTKSGMTLLITDKNEIGYGWGEEYKIQKENNGEWEDLSYKIIPIWNDIGFGFDDNCQRKQIIDWSKTYGELNTGKYRLIKKVYDNVEQKYIEFYLEFTIK